MHATETQSTDESLAPRVLRQGYSWLVFPQPLEQLFREQHRVNTHRLARMSLIVAFMSSSGFAFIDHWIIKSANAAPDIVRFGLQFPLLLVCLLATLRPFYMRWYERAVTIGLPLYGLGTVIMIGYAQPGQMPLVGTRLLLVTFFCYFMVGLRMRSALACNAAIYACVVGLALIGVLPPAIGWYMAFALLCANVIGAVGAYALEHASRTAFLERLALEEMAARDGLTRLLNRQTFEFRARSLWRSAAAVRRPIAVVMIDVDYFKRYNDHYGHQAGDECLRRVAASVREAINPARDELVARYGGEEIIALLVDRSAAEVEDTTRRIVAAIEGQAIPHHASVVCEHVSVSVGATLPTADASLQFNVLINIADQALYTAKHQGRNRSVVLPPQTAANDGTPTEGVTRPEARALQEQNDILVTSAAS